MPHCVRCMCSRVHVSAPTALLGFANNAWSRPRGGRYRRCRRGSAPSPAEEGTAAQKANKQTIASPRSSFARPALRIMVCALPYAVPLHTPVLRTRVGLRARSTVRLRGGAHVQAKARAAQDPLPIIAEVAVLLQQLHCLIVRVRRRHDHHGKVPLVHSMPRAASRRRCVMDDGIGGSEGRVRPSGTGVRSSQLVHVCASDRVVRACACGGAHARAHM